MQKPNATLSVHVIELYRRVDEVLYYIWDPTGMSFDPATRDAYYRYVPDLVHLLTKHPSVEEVTQYLDSIASSRMGLPDGGARVGKAARMLVEWQERLGSQPLRQLTQMRSTP